MTEFIPSELSAVSSTCAASPIVEVFMEAAVMIGRNPDANGSFSRGQRLATFGIDLGALCRIDHLLAKFSEGKIRSTFVKRRLIELKALFCQSVNPLATPPSLKRHFNPSRSWHSARIAVLYAKAIQLLHRRTVRSHASPSRRRT